MASQKDINNQKKLNEELRNTAEEAGFTKEALLSISTAIQSALNDATDSLNGLDTATKKVGKSLTSEITNNIKNLGPSLEKSISLTYKLNEGKDISKQISAEEEKLLVAQEGIQERINILSRNGIEIGDLESTLKKAIKIEQENIAKLLEKQNQTSEENAAKIQKANDLLGFTGKALSSINVLTKGFGSALGMDKVEKRMKAVAKETAETNHNFGKLKVLSAGVGEAFKQLGNSLTDPAIILAALIKGFTSVDKEATEFARQTGEDINTVGDSLDSLNMGYVNMADYIKAANTLTKDLGMNAKNIFSPEDLIEVSQMTDEIGLSAQAATKLAKFSALNGKSVKSSNESITEGVKSANAQNKTAYNTKQILEDVGNTSQGIAVSYAGYPKKLGEAATAAKSLGTNLEGVDKIASSLLNFESSISAELEAELITGKSLNLEKARQAALDNDLATVATEISKQVGSSADYSKMHRKEQEALAKAVGMSRDELAGSLVAREMEGKLTTEHLSKSQKIQYEAHKNREAQDKIAKSIAKIGQAFAPIVGFVADIVSNSYVLYSIMGLALLPKVLSLGSAFGGMFKSLSSIGGGGLGKSIGGMFKSIGKGISGTLKGIGRGLSSFGRGAMTAAPGIAAFGTSAIVAIPIIAALTGAVIGIGFALKLAAPAIEAIGGVITSIFGGIATVITSVTDGFVNMFNAVSMDNILPIMLLGPALLGIGAGLGLIATIGTAAIPALLALTALGAVSGGLNSMFGGEENNSPSNNEMAEVNANLKKLISVVEQGGVVMLDSNRVGEFLPKMLALNESKVGG